MLTNQVRELSSDLTELIRKHEKRDLTRTEIVRQLATEACVLLEKDDDLGARLMRDLCGQTVSVAACLPQTVDKTDDITDWKAERRMWKWLREILSAATAAVWDDYTDHRRLACAFLDQTVVILAEDVSTRGGDRAALGLVKQARETLESAVSAEPTA